MPARVHPLLARISEKTGITVEKTACASDDLPDLPIMNRVDVSIAMADACDVVRKNAAMVTRAKGGRGAVREVCEAILQAQGLWEKTLKRFM